MKLVITAGYDSSIPAIAMSELLSRSGHTINAVIVVSPYSKTRLQSMLRQRGIKGLKKVIKKLITSKKANFKLSPQTQFLLDKKIPFSSLKSWCKVNGVQYVLVKNINSPSSIECLRKNEPDAVIYSGGGILKPSFIEAANNNIVNNHSGLLPGIRGMNAIEWSILLQHEIGITIHMIDKGIDTGDIISCKRLTINEGETINIIREKAVLAGIIEIVRLFDGLTDLNNLEKKINRGSLEGRQCYILAPALEELLSRKLERSL
jgi:methionyl-tRNA formyltransferase